MCCQGSSGHCLSDFFCKGFLVFSLWYIFLPWNSSSSSFNENTGERGFFALYLSGTPSWQKPRPWTIGNGILSKLQPMILFTVCLSSGFLVSAQQSALRDAGPQCSTGNAGKFGVPDCLLHCSHFMLHCSDKWLTSQHHLPRAGSTPVPPCNRLWENGWRKRHWQCHMVTPSYLKALKRPMAASRRLF